jgi:hypothetical protein
MNLQNILEQLNDFAILFNLGDLNEERQKRAINRAIEYYQRRLGLPCNEFTYRVVYYAGNYYYVLPKDFNEIISVEYTNKNRNTVDNSFRYVPDDELMKTLGDRVYFTFNTFSVLRRDGVQKVIIVAKDSSATSNLIESFDNFIDVTKLSQIISSSTGISTLIGQNDQTRKTEGKASAWLKLVASADNPTLVIPLPDIIVSPISNEEEFFSLDIYLPDVSKITNIQLSFKETITTYTISAQTFNADYSPRSNGWNTLKFKKRDVESFDLSNLTEVKLKIYFNISNGQAYELWLDNFRNHIPDLIDVIYYSNYKGKNASGNFVLNLQNNTDVPLFDSIAPDLILPIVLRAAFYLAPQLKTNVEFTTLFFQEAENVIKNLGRAYPRKRCINYGKLKFSLT